MKLWEDSFGPSGHRAGVDFYAGKGGKLLPGELERWIGDNRRAELISRAQSDAMRGAVNDLYRPSSFSGDGGLADCFRFELETGRNIGRSGRNHLQKVQDMIRFLEKKLESGNLNESDGQLAKELLDDLLNALGEVKP